MSSVTRSKDAIYLIGHEDESFGTTETRLPSLRQVMRKLFFHIRSENMSVRDAARVTILAVGNVWEKARIPTKPQQHAVFALEKAYKEWVTLKKLINRKTESQISKEESFVRSLDRLFDISHSDAMSLIRIQEDRDFLLAQKESVTKGYMSKVDVALAEKEKRCQERAAAELSRKRRSDEEKAKFNVRVLSETIEDPLEKISDAGPSSEVDTLDSESEGWEQPEAKRTKSTEPASKINFITPELASALDRAGVSDRNATMIIAATLKALHLDMDKYAINRTTVRNARINRRQQISNDIRKTFTPAENMTLHWDGKLMRNFSGTDRADRLPVVVTSKDSAQLLGVPKLDSGTGIEQATAVAGLVTEWDIVDNVSGLSFDTTSSNTGPINGACVQIERLLGKEFLHLPCRHHIFELSLEAVFISSTGPTSGPDIPLFKRFQKAWSEMETRNITTLCDRSEVWDKMRDLVDEIAAFAESQLETFLPRDDYAELLHLVLIFIGKKKSDDYTFKAPGAYNNTRWMAKAIYSLKIWLFQKEFKLTSREEKGIFQVSLFVTFFYIQSWYTSHCAISAPRNDLEFAKRLISSSQEYPYLDVAGKKLARHLWYLGEELVGLAFFDSAVPLEVKRNMARAIKENEPTDCAKRLTVSDFKDLKEKTLADFVSQSTMGFFRCLKLNTDFLESDPENWLESQSFQKGLAAAKNLTVVNDHAERAVALAQSYNRLLTKDEEQYQMLLRCIERHRKTVPDVKKSTLKKV